MRNLLLLLLILGGGWYAWRYFQREQQRVKKKLDAERLRPPENLERDPESGRYRPKDGD